MLVQIARPVLGRGGCEMGRLMTGDKQKHLIGRVSSVDNGYG